VAAGVTSAFENLVDIVDVLEAWEQVRTGHTDTLRERSIVSAWQR
jgi:hypothetical protein